MRDHNTTSERYTLKRGNGQRNGRLAEDLAARFFQRHGLALLARTVRCRGGERDLVCRDARTLAFVAVRRRRNEADGGAAASFTTSPQDRVLLAGSPYDAVARACGEIRPGDRLPLTREPNHRHDRNARSTTGRRSAPRKPCRGACARRRRAPRSAPRELA